MSCQSHAMPRHRLTSPLVVSASTLTECECRACHLVADQYRIWCTFEAAIVHLRRLPVTMAGHRLSRLQVGHQAAIPRGSTRRCSKVTAARLPLQH